MAQHLAASSLLGEITRYTTPDHAQYARNSDGSIAGLQGADSAVLVIDGPVTKPWEQRQAQAPLNKAVYYKLNEGIGSVVRDSIGNGPDLVVTGDTTNIWKHAGWLTFGEGGNIMQGVGDSYLESIF